MPRVAIVGGTSPTIGRSITESLLKASHEPFILSRKDQPDKYGVKVRGVKYESISDLKEKLQEVHTVISVLKIFDWKESVKIHKNILEAAKQADVKRLVISDWSVGPKASEYIDVFKTKPDLAKLTEDETIDCCMIYTGMWMNYLVLGCNKPELEAGLVDDMCLSYIDVGNKNLILPVNDKGEPVRVSMTEINDIGRMMAATMELPLGTMRGQLGMHSETKTFGEVADHLKQFGYEVKTRRFTRKQGVEEVEKQKELLQEELAKGNFDVKIMMQKFMAEVCVMDCDEVVGGSINTPDINRLLEEHGIKVETTNLNEYLEKAWIK